MKQTSPDILFWVTHLLGTGHLFRTAAIARALSEHGANVVVASGGIGEHGVDFGGAELVRLPGVRARDASYRELLDETGAVVGDALLARRAALLSEIFGKLKPDAFVTELYPFGRRKFRGELLDLLSQMRSEKNRPAVIASVRDILEPPGNPNKAKDAADTFAAYYDLVMVHGDSANARLEDSFVLPGTVSQQVRYTGYVRSGQSAEARGRGADGAGEILVSAGGGGVGLALYEAAIEASRILSLSDVPWRLLVGRNVEAADFEQLVCKADGINVIIERARPDFVEMLKRARLSVSQAGYNTVVDILDAGVRSVLIPFAQGGEREQSIRAGLLAERGRAIVVNADEACAQHLARAIEAALAQPTPSIDGAIALEGAEVSAQWILEAARSRRAIYDNRD